MMATAPLWVVIVTILALAQVASSLVTRRIDCNISTATSYVETCFCFYSGGCLSLFECQENHTWNTCQMLHCGEKTLDITSSTASFFNIKDHGDVLTIPRKHYRDIAHLVDCEAKPIAIELLEHLLKDGRRVFIEKKSVSPEYQCFHRQHFTTVSWLHLHTFIGFVPGEGLPGTSATAACVFANVTIKDAAQRLWTAIDGQQS